MKAIAIDGPSGVGKSTLAAIISKNWGYLYLDTGALYRAVGLYVLEKGVDTENSEAVCALLPEIALDVRYKNGVQRVLLGERDVSEEIRTHAVSKAASDVSAYGPVRAFLLDRQRDIAKAHDVVMDGRDIGTVILPQADLKIFLTASAAERARRRHAQLLEKGQNVPPEQVLRDIEARDANDSGRALAPLRPAEDAVQLDSSTMTLEETVAAIEALMRERGLLK